MDNTNTIIIFLSCIMGIMIFGKLLILPLKKIIKLVINSLMGGILIFLINYVGVYFNNFHIGLNVITAIFVRNTRNTRSYIISHIQSNNNIEKDFFNIKKKYV